jgi:hypothetical protein
MDPGRHVVLLRCEDGCLVPEEIVKLISVSAGNKDDTVLGIQPVCIDVTEDTSTTHGTKYALGIALSQGHRFTSM